MCSAVSQSAMTTCGVSTDADDDAVAVGAMMQVQKGDDHVERRNTEH